MTALAPLAAPRLNGGRDQGRGHGRTGLPPPP